MVIVKRDIRKFDTKAHITVKNKLKDSFIGISSNTFKISIKILVIPEQIIIKR